MTVKEKLRIDKYLWAIRIFKTRTEAATACDRGKVKFNGTAVKASRQVHEGDEYEIKTDAKRWVIKVSALLSHRLKYAEAVNYYIDISPVADPATKVQTASFYTGKRASKIGRPTKKERRELDDFFD